ncbi:MAG: alpha/beta fold hydrolase [Solobacterium sp.]|nr:alpha/beta fold hydrolase [Solobacterium sp.]
MLSEKIIINEGGKYPLNGILMLPEKDQPVPAVVLVHGSGSSNMDEKVMKLTPFKDLAEGLCKYGIASIRYDKRSYVYGMKMIKEGNITVKEETIEDAVKAAELLRNDPRIDHDNIYIIGHSMGATLAPRIDAEGGNFKGLILMAGSLRDLDDILLGQLKELSEGKGLKAWAVRKSYEKMQKQFENLREMNIEETKKIKTGGGTTLYYFREMVDHPASEYLKNSEKPLLIMQGEKDFQVKKDVDFNMYRDLLKDHPDATFKLYENLNHCFVRYAYESISAGSAEFKEERHISDSVIADIACWISNHSHS